MGYKEALQQIQHAETKGATRLELSDQNLLKIPPEVFRLKKLVYLDLSENRISELPQGLFQLPKLTRLVLGKESPKNKFTHLKGQ